MSAVPGVWREVSNSFSVDYIAGALFFSTYETSKSLIGAIAPNQKHSPLGHMAAAASGEMVRVLTVSRRPNACGGKCGMGVEMLVIADHIMYSLQAACLVRTPTEIVKQRMQTGVYKSLPEALNAIRAAEGVAGFYRGYWSMIAREIPFSFIQFPLWEGLKVRFTYPGARLKVGIDVWCHSLFAVPMVEAAERSRLLAAGCGMRINRRWRGRKYHDPA